MNHSENLQHKIEKYQTFDPCDDLKNYIKSYWTFEDKWDIDTPIIIVPSWYIDMIFHLGDDYIQHTNSDSFVQPKAFVIWPNTEPLILQPTWTTSIFAIRFYAYGLSWLTHISPESWQSIPLWLEHIFWKFANEIFFQISTLSITQKISYIESFFLKHISIWKPLDSLIVKSIHMIYQNLGVLSIDELCKNIGIWQRQLERKFKQTIGMTPKQFTKIVKVYHFWLNLRKNNKDSITKLAYKQHYYDQSHCIKDFRSLTKVTPRTLQQDINQWKLFY